MTTRTNNRTIVAGAVGNALELYDFAVFGFFAPIMSAQFFPSDDPVAGLLKTFGIFAIGYLARPIGGLIFGRLGDRIGRQRILKYSIALMAVPTTLIAVLPTYAEIGIWAAVLLILLRVLQGLSTGGEFVGSICYLVEIAPSHRRGFVGSFTMFSGNIGVMAGSAVAATLHMTLSTEALAEWGWRLPFLGGLVLGIVGWLLRRQLLETPAFENVLARGAAARSPLLQAIREMPGALLLVTLMVMILGVGFYTLAVWMPTYLTHIVAPPVDHALLINTAAILLIMALMPFGGLFADHVGYKKVLVTAAIALAAIAYPLFMLMDTGTFVAVVAGQMSLVAVFAFINGTVPIALAAQFPVAIRNSALALAYNVSMALFGGTAPLIATWLIRETGDLAAPAFYITATALISCVAILMLRGRFAHSDTP
ncbi:MAG: MFS transporter [Pseudomonadota bacterium]